VGDEEGDLVLRMGWASRMIMCHKEVNMSDEDGLGDEDGTGDNVNWEDGNLFVKSVETVNKSMTLGLSQRYLTERELGGGRGNQVHVFMS